jgi:hypothetical protein
MSGEMMLTRTRRTEGEKDVHLGILGGFDFT